MIKYSWNNSGKINIVFYLTVICVISYPFIENGIRMFCEYLIEMFPDYDMSIFKMMNSLLSIISVSMLFKFIDWLFDKYLWKYKYIMKILGIHDFSGKWSGTLKSSYSDAYEIPIILEIDQSWRMISCRCEFPDTNSTSVADMVQIDISDRSSPLLKFTYRNQSRAMNTLTQIHIGYNELRFIDGKLNGFYFTNRNPPTKGNMILEKIN